MNQQTPLSAEASAPSLQGVRVAVTHTSEQAEEQARLFSAKGATVYYYPAIELVPFEKNDDLDNALREAAAGNFDWLVLNDADTILVVADRIKALGLDPSRFPRRLKVATIGCMTEQWTEEMLGIRSDFAPEVYDTQWVAKALGVGPANRVLVPQSATTRATLAKCLVETGAQVSAVNAYRTLIGRGGDPLPSMLWEGKIDVVTFTFPTAVRYFNKRIKAEGGGLNMLDNVIVACIGPLTETAARDLGLHVEIVPKKHSISGLVDAISEYVSAHR